MTDTITRCTRCRKPMVEPRPIGEPGDPEGLGLGPEGIRLGSLRLCEDCFRWASENPAEAETWSLELLARGIDLTETGDDLDIPGG